MTLGVAVIDAIVGGSVGVRSTRASASPPIRGWWLGAVILVLGFVTTSPWAQETAAQTADRFPEDGRRPARYEHELAPWVGV